VVLRDIPTARDVLSAQLGRFQNPMPWRAFLHNLLGTTLSR